MTLFVKKSKTIEDWIIKDVALQDRNKAIELLVYKYHDAIVNRARRILNSTQDAFDISQEVFIRAFLDQGLFAPERKLRGWLLAVARNLSLNMRRDRRRRDDKTSLERPCTFSETSQYEKYLKSQRAAVVNMAIGELNERYREVIRYFYFQDLTCVEIADIMNTNEQNVRKLMHRARGNLKVIIEPHLR